jgi:hypothetical protein
VGTELDTLTMAPPVRTCALPVGRRLERPGCSCGTAGRWCVRAVGLGGSVAFTPDRRAWPEPTRGPPTGTSGSTSPTTAASLSSGQQDHMSGDQRAALTPQPGGAPGGDHTKCTRTTFPWPRTNSETSWPSDARSLPMSQGLPRSGPELRCGERPPG